jgi:predicted nucleic acid-binding protein
VILVDTSVWVEHLRRGDHELAQALADGRVLAHPWVTGELALGGASDAVLGLLDRLPQATVATDHEVRTLIRNERLTGAGIGWVDAALLASLKLTPDAALLTRDRRLAEAAA